MFATWKITRIVILAIGLLLAGFAMASGLAAARGAPQREPQAASNAQLREGLAVLHQTKLLLEQADHDYGGHRVNAIKAISAAHHQLKLALETQTKHKIHAGGGGKGVAGGGKEPQAASNMQLAVSIAVLKKTAVVLEGADHDYGGHRAAAVRDIHVAVRELETALKFEKRKREGK
jgi:hypothetical protein